MHNTDAGSEVDGSSDLSSNPASPQSTIRVSHSHPNPNSGVSGIGVTTKPASSALPNPTPLHAKSTTTKTAAAPDKPVVKRQRKKKVLDGEGKPIDDGKPKKPRAPRKKPVKTETANVPDITRQPGTTEMLGSYQQAPMAAPSTHSTSAYPEVTNRGGLVPQASKPPTPRPVSSGQNYDPVRSATMDQRPPRPAPTPVGISSAQASPHVNRASASPSIASLIDPPCFTNTSAPTAIPSPQLSVQRQPQQSKTQPAPTYSKAKTTAPPPPYPHTSPIDSNATPVAIPTFDGAMDVDASEGPKPQSSSVKERMPDAKQLPSKSPSSAATPKAARPTPPPAPKGTGSGLLSSGNLFGGPTNTTSERRSVNIDIQIKLDPAGGNIINIAQEVFKKYGRNAINPRAAAHRERLLQVATAANKIDPGSADDMSVDLSELDNDSNVEMGGMDDTASAQQDGEKPRKRRKKIEEYDKEDDFIDDTELAWQEQAAVAKDGFFVYSGKLIPPGQDAQVESATAAGRGGRGRGRGRGRAAAATGASHAAVAKDKESKDSSTTAGRGRGRGRATGVLRKPRMTKADRERMEAEKLERAQTGPAPTTATAACANAAASPAPQNTSIPMNSLPGHQQAYSLQGLGATS
jgi:hypothetical protein